MLISSRLQAFCCVLLYAQLAMLQLILDMIITYYLLLFFLGALVLLLQFSTTLLLQFSADAFCFLAMGYTPFFVVVMLVDFLTGQASS